MAKNGAKAQPETKPRPAMSFGPYPTDRNTSVETSVWANEMEANGDTFTTYNVTIKRSYRDENGNWHANANMRPHDLPILIHALAKCHDWILERKNPANSEE